MQCKRCPSYEVTIDPEGITWRRCRWDGHQVYDNMECDAHSIKIKAFCEAKEEMRKETHQMENGFITLVLATHSMTGEGTVYLFQSPLEATLEKGDEIKVQTKRGIASAWVIDTIVVRAGEKAYKFILKATKAYEPLQKVISRVKYEIFHYDEWEAEDAN